MKNLCRLSACDPGFEREPSILEPRPKALTNTLRSCLPSWTHTHKFGLCSYHSYSSLKCPWLTEHSFVSSVNQSTFITLRISYCQQAACKHRTQIRWCLRVRVPHFPTCLSSSAKSEWLNSIKYINISKNTLKPQSTAFVFQNTALSTGPASKIILFPFSLCLRLPLQHTDKPAHPLAPCGPDHSTSKGTRK